MTENQDLIVEIDNSVATMTLNRPEQYNALSEGLLGSICDTLDTIAKDESVRAVVFAANGKAFCAGHDLKQMRQSAELAAHHKLFSKCSEMMQKIVNLPQPVIARVQGMATAAGCQLVATCDMAVACETAQFAVSGIRVGLFCSTPAVALSRNVSAKRAMEMLMTGDFIDASAAMEYGLVNKVVKPDMLDRSTNELVGKIIRHPGRVVNLGKKMFYRQLNQDLPSAYKGATETISSNMMLEEAIEGIDAFIEKRPPDWTNFPKPGSDDEHI